MEIKQVMVALDLTEMDEKLIKFTCYLDKIFKFEKIYFIHVARTLEYPEEVIKNHPELLAPLDEAYKHTIQQELDKCWRGKREKAILKVTDGNPSEKLLKWARIKDVDMIIAGRKSNLAGSGLIPGKITRGAPCSVLLVPENARFEMNKILLSVDFSRHSYLVAEQCVLLARENKGTKLILFHVYKVPLGYSKVGKTFEEFKEIMKGHAENDMKRFTEKIDLEGVDCEFVYECSHDKGPLDEIMEYATGENVDMLSVGSKGRTNAASFLLGSLAEKLVRRNENIPFLVVKQKGSNMDFLDALFRL